MMENLITGMLTAEEGMALGFGMMILLVYLFVILLAIGIYIYSAFALMAIAKKTNTEPAWLAWIPVANMVLVSRIAKMHWWPVLLMIPAMMFFGVGYVFILLNQTTLGIILMSIYALMVMWFGVYCTIWYWKMFEAVNRPGWWSLTAYVPTAVYLVTYIISMAFESPLILIPGMLISVIGSVMYLILLGIAAWSDSPGSKPAVVTKISDLKNKVKNNKR